MFGLINFILRDLLIKKYGDDVWAQVCMELDIPISTKFNRHEHYSDSSSIDILKASAKVLKVEESVMMEKFGEFFIVYLREDGYNELLRCLGDSFEEWIANINNLHDHLEHTLYLDTTSYQYRSPRFWSTAEPISSENPSQDDTYRNIILHYQSYRGAALVSMVVGMIREVAHFYFDINLSFDQLSLQGESGARYTSWRLRGDKAMSAPVPSSHAFLLNVMSNSMENHKCPLTSEARISSSSPEFERVNLSEDINPESARSTISPPRHDHTDYTCKDLVTASSTSAPCLGNRQMKILFPFCIVFDESMTIIDCGNGLIEILRRSPIGMALSESLVIEVPMGITDSWSNFLQLHSDSISCSAQITSDDGMVLQLKGMMLTSDDYNVGYFMCHPNVRSLDEMKQSRLSPRHLVSQPCAMEYVLLSTNLASEQSASKKLQAAQEELRKERAAIVNLNKDIAKRAKQQAEQSMETKRTFVRYISHEIRTPLTVVKLGLRLALADAKQIQAGDDFISNIVDCEDSIEVALAILNDLLVYEKLDSGILEMFKEKVLGIPFLIRCFRPFERDAELKKISLNIENHCEKEFDDLILYVDKSKMSQVMRNFISNSLKFTPEYGSVTVRISMLKPENNRLASSRESPQKPAKVARVSSGSPVSHSSSFAMPSKSNNRRFMKCICDDSVFTLSGGQSSSYNSTTANIDDKDYELLEDVLLIEFIDSGVGISKENQKKLFKDKIQFDPHATQAGGGSGVGLWNVRSNDEGQQGVTFSIELPIYKRNFQSLTNLRAIHAPKFSKDFLEYGSCFDNDEEGVSIKSDSVIDLQMDVDDSLDQRQLLEAMANDKVLRLSQKEKEYEERVPTVELNVMPENIVNESNKLPHTEEESGGKTYDAGVDHFAMGPLCGARILLIDDSKLILRVTSKTLSSLGVVCDTAISGELGIEMINSLCRTSTTEATDIESRDSNDCEQWNNGYYDLVMLDKQMPGMDGLQTCEKLRSMGFGGNMIGVTGSCMPSEVEEFRRAGIDEVFAKPLDIPRLEHYFLKVTGKLAEGDDV